ncbi:hypothetical protein M427DRAFT_424999 [Gonapodya prolifera JEL478]|uniref:FCH domain-containing protein n=1 Tax=Gonapodya prolifera (strain JEL478) TaxID=1344416 RepID=A0A139A4G9_GONPJ|nr:hypothetical protein M427DRAFT_424999 [Gonapodya prolifera JEL478]|eukprot:KXS11614.1 hypothetical protein M427DRAFT_424999 [Gonapodya prolifera JEL478]
MGAGERGTSVAVCADGCVRQYERGKVAVDSVVGRIRRGEALDKDMSDMLRERVRIERDYSKQLSMLASKPMQNRDAVGSFGHLIDLVLSATDRQARLHAHLAQLIADQCDGPLRLRADEAKAVSWRATNTGSVSTRLSVHAAAYQLE